MIVLRGPKMAQTAVRYNLLCVLPIRDLANVARCEFGSNVGSTLSGRSHHYCKMELYIATISCESVVRRRCEIDLQRQNLLWFMTKNHCAVYAV